MLSRSVRVFNRLAVRRSVGVGSNARAHDRAAAGVGLRPGRVSPPARLLAAVATRPMNRLPRLVILILILAAVAVATPATAPVNAQDSNSAPTFDDTDPTTRDRAREQ